MYLEVFLKHYGTRAKLVLFIKGRFIRNISVIWYQRSKMAVVAVSQDLALISESSFACVIQASLRAEAILIANESEMLLSKKV